jgi:hypothetical protein
MKSGVTTLALTAALLAAPAVSAQTFTPPPGCTGFLTVQARGCKVSNHYRCDGDAPGEQWRADFDAEGPYFVSKIDYETQWVLSVDLISGSEQTLSPNPADAASFSGLLATGTDTYDFGQTADTGDSTRVRGFDTLTGRKVVIDGVELEETNFELREMQADGSLLHAGRGKEYIHRAWRLFFSGPSEWDGGEGFRAVDRSPVTFAQPGEAGFMASKPEYDCDAQLASLRAGE